MPDPTHSYRFKGQWRGATRQEVLKRWNYRCAACGNPGSDGKGKGLQQAHVVDDFLGGSVSAENLVPLCRHCHRIYDAAKKRALR